MRGTNRTSANAASRRPCRCAAKAMVPHVTRCKTVIQSTECCPTCGAQRHGVVWVHNPWVVWVHDQYGHSTRTRACRGRPSARPHDARVSQIYDGTRKVTKSTVE